ncbi:MAG: hypothetical protein CME63_01350 [Halobacteriovoraceae bacterium]|nr:hypothetical protein [Halobacteriovoraceae bacterium]
MTMKARVSTDALGNITVHMEGGLDFENNSPFQQELESLTRENPSSTITIDMHGLDFVGSSGIGMFVDTIKSINRRREQIKMSNVKIEFLKVFKLYDMDFLEIIEDQFDDDQTMNLSQRFMGKRRTFEN